MRILQVISYFNPKFGGDVNVCKNLSKQLVKRGHDVTIITTDYRFDSAYARDAEAYGIKVIPFHTKANVGLFFYTPSINRWLRDNVAGFDVIHSHNFRSYQNARVLNYAMPNDVCFVLQAHGSVLPILEKQVYKKAFDFVWGNRLLLHSSKLIAVSRSEIGQYLEMGIKEKMIVTIPNGIDISKFDQIPNPGTFRSKFGISSDEKVILYLGRLHKRKGIDFLIRGFSELTVQDAKTKLLIVGPDEGFFEKLSQQVKESGIEDRVIFTGFVSEEEKLEALVDADVLVYPGVREIFGLVPFEAIMCGTPVIVCDDSGCGEIIDEARCGYLVKYGDTHELKGRIETLIRNSDEARAMVRNGQAYIADRLQWKTVGNSFEKLYEDCIRHV